MSAAAGGGDGGGNRVSLESVCMTRDTREMMGPGAPVVVFCDRSRYLRYTGASLYCGLPTYFFCCDLDDHSGLTLDKNLISVTNEDYFFCDVVSVCTSLHDVISKRML